MGIDDTDTKKLTVTNVTQHQYGWLIQEAEKRGLSKSVVVKLFLQEAYENSIKKQRVLENNE